MTSKEAVDRIKNDIYSKRYSKNKLLKIIKKHLEILEAIKNLLNDGVLWLEIEHEMVESKLHKKEKQLIKEWLDNENNNL